MDEVVDGEPQPPQTLGLAVDLPLLGHEKAHALLTSSTPSCTSSAYALTTAFALTTNRSAKLRTLGKASPGTKAPVATPSAPVR